MTASWSIPAVGVNRIVVDGATVTVKRIETSEIGIEVPGSRSEWRVGPVRNGRVVMSRTAALSDDAGAVHNVISGGVHMGPVIQAGNISGLSIGADGAINVDSISQSGAQQITLTLSEGITVEDDTSVQ